MMRLVGILVLLSVQTIKVEGVISGAQSVGHHHHHSQHGSQYASANSASATNTAPQPPAPPPVGAAPTFLPQAVIQPARAIVPLNIAPPAPPQALLRTIVQAPTSNVRQPDSVRVGQVPRIHSPIYAGYPSEFERTETVEAPVARKWGRGAGKPLQLGSPIVIVQAPVGPTLGAPIPLPPTQQNYPRTLVVAQPPPPPPPQPNLIVYPRPVPQPNAPYVLRFRR